MCSSLLATSGLWIQSQMPRLASTRFWVRALVLCRRRERQDHVPTPWPSALSPTTVPRTPGLSPHSLRHEHRPCLLVRPLLWQALFRHPLPPAGSTSPGVIALARRRAYRVQGQQFALLRPAESPRPAELPRPRSPLLHGASRPPAGWPRARWRCASAPTADNTYPLCYRNHRCLDV